MARRISYYVGQPIGMITGYIAEGLFQDYKDIAVMLFKHQMAY